MQKEAASKNRSIGIIIILLLFSIIIVLLYLFLAKSKKEDKQVSTSAESIRQIDDFYYAVDGTWKMETTIHILKSQKFISSNAELKDYLVYTATPEEIVRITQASGRWKKLEVFKNEKLIATGWADAEDACAELQISKNK